MDVNRKVFSRIQVLDQKGLRNQLDHRGIPKRLLHIVLCFADGAGGSNLTAASRPAPRHVKPDGARG